MPILNTNCTLDVFVVRAFSIIFMANNLCSILDKFSLGFGFCSAHFCRNYTVVNKLRQLFGFNPLFATCSKTANM